jgi:hypothetical protein
MKKIRDRWIGIRGFYYSARIIADLVPTLGRYRRMVQYHSAVALRLWFSNFSFTIDQATFSIKNILTAHISVY